MSDNKRALLSLTEHDVMELRNLLSMAKEYRGGFVTPEVLLPLVDKWELILTSSYNVLSSPVPIHFTDLGTEP